MQIHAAYIVNIMMILDLNDFTFMLVAGQQMIIVIVFTMKNQDVVLF